jgi:hypothetical protein
LAKLGAKKSALKARMDEADVRMSMGLHREFENEMEVLAAMSSHKERRLKANSRKSSKE